MADALSELVKTLRYFIIRDMIYIIGGGIVLASVFDGVYGLDRLDNPPVALWLLLGGVAWVVGYALQDGSGLVRLSSTLYTPQPNVIIKKLYLLFTRERWDDSQLAISVLATTWCETKDEHMLAEGQRIIHLMMVGTTMAPCLAVAAVVFLGRHWGSFPSAKWLLGISGLVLSFVLWALGWVKNLQLTTYVARLHAGMSRLPLKVDSGSSCSTRPVPSCPPSSC